MKKFLPLFFVLFSLNLLSQTNDTIILRTGEIIACQIRNVSKSGLVTYDFINTDGERAMAQKSISFVKEIKYASENLEDFKIEEEIYFMPGINDTASLLLSDAMKQIEKATNLTNAGIVFGSAANLCVLFDAGLLSGNFEDWHGYVYAVGISTSLVRGSLSFATFHHLTLANINLLKVRDISGDNTLFENSLNHVLTARRASRAVIFLGLAAWSLIPAGFIGIVYDESDGIYGNCCYIAGWACAVASLTCTFISSYHIFKAKKSLRDDLGGLNLGMNKYGIGISYNF